MRIMWMALSLREGGPMQLPPLTPRLIGVSPLSGTPPSASSPPQHLALEEGAKTVQEPIPAPAPELPRVI